MNMESISNPARTGRGQLFRDILVFQAKLVADGLRDLLLVPASLIAGAISLLRGGEQPGKEFYDLLKHGRRSERWINLFGVLKERGLDVGDRHGGVENIDQIADRVEAFIVHEYNKGEVSAKARDRLNRALDALQKRSRKNSGGNAGE